MSISLNSTLTATGEQWIFPEGLQQLLDTGEDELVSEIIEVYKSQTRSQLRLLRNAVESGLLKEVRAYAHTIKGGSSQVGANDLAAVCLAIETATGCAAEIPALVSKGELLFEEVCRLISVSPPANIV